ncbi:uracil-DNA glycosylase [Rhodohalobacter sulfatireducens]|uniref:Type-4 uracil-DNA glycosylase n=1 Tax=Rhodohalobacter sulfatireducens TaxID=2911366 RepID=A0ABS9KDQ5_9BACT|nr:uracil-DNA glycosylase [Rhodohalobacter sulfatireducens]MCG2588965.1 uracil-DNA glycosylase [Rhodohalobacter sulfatireducens]
MSDKKEQLYEDILRFLEYEKEVYGAFTITEADEINHEEVKTESKPIVEEEAEGYSTKVSEEPTSLEEKLEACSSLKELRDLCKSAKELKTDLENTNLVFGVGNPNADLMIIGEAPGQEEDRQGEPFVGKAGQLLNKILKAIDFDREDVYIANILKHRPPGNRNPNPDERLRSLPYLMRQIDLIDPKIILCVGKVSGTTLLKKEDSLRNLRGQFYPFRGAELTVTYHPAALLRNPQWKRPTWEDVQKVRKRYDELGCKPS